MDTKNKSVTILGDSITYGVGASSEEKRYADILKKIALFDRVNNFGISGTRIARQINVNPDDWTDIHSFCERFDGIDDADIIIVFGGTNDYGHGDAPFGTFEDRTPYTYCGALHFLMQGLINKFPSSEIVFLTPMQRTGGNKLNTSNNRPLSDYADMIKKTAAYYSLPVLDLYSSLGICPDINIHKESFCPDGLHPNDEGHLKIAKRIKGFLETL